MADTVIRLEHLSKQYRIGRIQARYDTLRDQIAETAQNLFRRNHGQNEEETSIWALRDVSLEVERGRVLGLIGANGAGKSTLLKILSQITEPTEGRVWLKGRVGALLEVGTGFHPELTGRENVYLNGAILGMTKAEIDRKFDQIVEFAEVESFIDTPVKRYSSGMQVRLAFSVAAHLEPEILLVDEVLSVGDAEFQRKSLGRMRGVVSEGRTVILVSHNMASVEQLCDEVALLEKGHLAMIGSPGEVIRHYLRRHSEFKMTSVDLRDHPGRLPGHQAVFEQFRLLDVNGQEAQAFPVGDTLVMELTINPEGRHIPNALLNVSISDDRDQTICKFRNDKQLNTALELPGRTTVTIAWPDCNLAPGEYVLNLSLKAGPDKVDQIDQVLVFEMVPGNIYGTGKTIKERVLIWPRSEWRIEHEPVTDNMA
jgi:lipopolysaccharide transport system ATP-binding protein